MTNREKALVATLEEIEQCYASLSQGLTVSTALRFRLEGKCALLNELGLLSFEQLRSHCEKAIQQYRCPEVDDVFWQWCEMEGQLRLPFISPVAPVKP